VIDERIDGIDALDALRNLAAVGCEDGDYGDGRCGCWPCWARDVLQGGGLAAERGLPGPAMVPERLEQENDRYRAALRFYAESINWAAQNPPGSGAPAWHDHGQRAAAALAPLRQRD
jgi:hypothetical protein